MKLSPSERQWRREQPSTTLAVAILSVALLGVPVNFAAAQHSDAHSDGNAARTDAMFGTPDRYGTTPQDNIFATTPGLEQQARRSQFTINGLLPMFYNSNADLAPVNGPPAPTRRSSARCWALRGRRRCSTCRPGLRRTCGQRSIALPRPGSHRWRPRSRQGRPVGPAAIHRSDQRPEFLALLLLRRRALDSTASSGRLPTRQDLNLGLNKTYNFNGRLRARGVLATPGRHGVVVG